MSGWAGVVQNGVDLVVGTAGEEVGIEARGRGSRQDRSAVGVEDDHRSAGRRGLFVLEVASLDGVVEERFGGLLKGRVEREDQLAANAGILLVTGLDETAAVVHQVDAETAPAVEEAFVLTLEPGPPHAIAGTVVGGLAEFVRLDGPQVAEHVGGQSTGRIDAASLAEEFYAGVGLGVGLQLGDHVQGQVFGHDVVVEFLGNNEPGLLGFFHGGFEKLADEVGHLRRP